MRSLIIDCDPGVDDAIALLLAFASRAQLRLLGITTVAGNVAGSLTARNACIIRELAGAEDVPVFAGCERPLVREPIDAGDFHGATGLGALNIFSPRCGVEPGHAVTFIIEALRREPTSSVTLATLGPMTNLALALRLAPDVEPRIAQIVAMGGARREGGNVTASAEYNIFADPHAAKVVLGSAIPIVMLGLDVTHQVRATPPRVAALRALGSRSSTLAVQLLDFCNQLESNAKRGTGAALHDPCVLAYLLQPQLFVTEACHIDIETDAALTRGATAVEFRNLARAPRHTQWGVAADADGIFSLLGSALSKL